MLKTFFAAFCLLFLLVGCSEETVDKQTPPNSNAEFSVIAKNLNEPWEIQLINETFYISERTEAIVTVENGDQTRKTVNFDQEISNQAEAGLLGIAINEPKEAFAYYSYQENGEYFQRVIRMRETKNSWQEIEILLDKIPGGKYHQGGRIAIGPDDKLYITTGDATVENNAQDLDSLSGKILRMNMDGSIPKENPFDDSYIYSYGHRNPQGLAWNDDGILYATEHGSNAYDEINRIVKGGNYGWPDIRGDETKAEMIAPVAHSGETTWAPSGMDYLEGEFYYASLRGQGVRKFNPENLEVKLIINEFGRVRDVLAADNGIYFITNNTDGRGEPAK
ncbi:PQQ-dependent sugar dehydrogenase, partial [Virgibacillus sp. DJP39]|uniref:PQQ-dependent sugar dehydrogenase n=1 Tax=Virgibacillus sp. DJP39 TaxID=3409790 RepID=UPI003BB78994